MSLESVAQDIIAEGNETFFLNVALTGIAFENGAPEQAFEITIIDNALPQGGVTITGEALENQTLTAAPGHHGCGRVGRG